MRFGKVWFGLDIIFMFTVVRCGVVRYGKVRYGEVRFGLDIIFMFTVVG